MTPLGFPRERRVRLGADFTRIFAEGQRHHGRYFRLHWRDSEQPARLGLAVSRKVDKHAVGRNRIKRTARESFRICCATLPTGDAVLVARPEAARVDSDQLRSDLDRLWQRLRSLPGSHSQGTMRQRSSGSSPLVDASPAAPPSSSSA
jgi:ribonuclease P protein component